MSNRLSRSLLYLLLFILPLQTRYFAFVRTINNQWWEYGSFTIYASECILWFLAFVIGGRYIYKLIQARSEFARVKPVALGIHFDSVEEYKNLSLRGAPYSARRSNLECSLNIARDKLRQSLPLMSSRMIKSILLHPNFILRALNFARKHKGIIAAGIFICYALISIIWSVDRGSTAIYVFRLIEVCIFIALIAHSGAKFQNIVGFFVAGVFANAVLGISQFYAQTVWGSAWFGIAGHSPEELGASVVETYLRRYIRVYGGFPHPNIFGGWLVAALMLVPFLYSILSKHCHCKKNISAGAPSTSRTSKHCHCEERCTRRDEAISKKSLMMQIGLLVVYAALFTALVMSFSRSAWIGFTLGLVVLCALVFTGKLKDVFGKKFNWIVLAKFLFITGIMGVFLGVLLFEPLVERGSGIFATSAANRLEHKSILERTAGASDALKVFSKFPIFGTGFGAYTSVLHTLYRDRAVWDIQPVHSVFLMVISELGIVGGIFALAMLFFFLRHSFRARNFFGLILFASFLPLMLFDHYLWTLYSGLMLFGAIIGISLVHKKI